MKNSRRKTFYQTGSLQECDGTEGPSPAHDVADDIGVAYEDLITVFLLLDICPVDVVSEGGLDPGSIFIILLGAERGT